ncbi:biotin/lipoyl-containing protein [Kineobactrum salinum]|uniref:Biotin/lipoyl-binding protein n=1 Tax=Kineobactrum salinum TaxID=2708301 RepID=A0A6C0U3W8_9GAMM|nr:biotin/lipoyl-containing protein [Kineobactrum salinum]QIB66840.1 biotin/lipoyl-binding protein [Kineobactrum salinum]
MTEVTFPKIGFAMTEGTLARWLVEDGSNVEEGQPLYELESEKSIQEVESPATGIIHIEAEADKVYAVGIKLGWIE